MPPSPTKKKTRHEVWYVVENGGFVTTADGAGAFPLKERFSFFKAFLFSCVLSQSFSCHHPPPRKRPDTRSGLSLKKGGFVTTADGACAFPLKERFSFFNAFCFLAFFHRASRATIPHQQKDQTRGLVFFLVGDGGFGPPKSVTTDLQSAPFGRSGNPPGAGDRSRTNNLLITNQLLCH